VELVRRGLAQSRDRARADISAGRVRVGGAPADKPARLVAASDPVVLTGPPPRFVGRGGEKLDAALDRFGVAVAGLDALDAGASTGGFTDCLLQRGAARVVAVDVGYGQLDARLRADRRVTVLERTNIRHLGLDDVGGRPFPVVVADLSFISLGTVAPALLALAEPGGAVVALVKPQFEAGPAEAGRGKGVIRDPEVWRRVLEDVRGVFSAHRARLCGLMVSPLRGAQGNVEFLAHFVPGAGSSASAADIPGTVAAAAAGG